MVGILREVVGSSQLCLDLRRVLAIVYRNCGDKSATLEKVNTTVYFTRMLRVEIRETADRLKELGVLDRERVSERI